jgi:hypothetical protein
MNRPMRPSRLHQTSAARPLRRRMPVTLAVLRHDHRVPSIAAVLVLSSVPTRPEFESWQMWPVDAHATVRTFDSAWVRLIASFRIGGVLAPRRPRDSTLPALGLPRVLHQSVPADVRIGIKSGAGAATWAMLQPSALGFDDVTQRFGIHTAGRLPVAVSAAIAGLLHPTRRLDPTTLDTVVDVNDACPICRRPPVPSLRHEHRRAHGGVTPQSPQRRTHHDPA